MSRVDAAWEQLLAGARKRQEPRLPLGEYEFLRIAWEEVRPVALATALMDPRRSYRGHREVLLAAFVAWVFAPNNRPFQRNSARLAIGRVMSSFDKPGSADPIMASFLARTYHGLNFLERVYLPTGGMSGLLKAPSGANLLRRRKAIEIEVKPLFNLTHQLHHIVPEWRSGACSRPSMRKLAGTVGKSKTVVNPIWVKYRESIALRYAATSLVANGRSLWDRVISGTAPGTIDPLQMAEWVGRARWYASEILMQLADDQFGRENLTSLPQVELRPFGPPRPADEWIVRARSALTK